MTTVFSGCFNLASAIKRKHVQLQRVVCNSLVSGPRNVNISHLKPQIHQDTFFFEPLYKELCRKGHLTWYFVVPLLWYLVVLKYAFSLSDIVTVKKTFWFTQTKSQQNNISCLGHTNYNIVRMIKTSHQIQIKVKPIFIHKKTF